MQPSRIAEFVMSRLVSSSKAKRVGAIQRRAFSLLRKLLASRGNRNLRFTLGGHEILVPLGHDLPLIRAEFPQYSTNIARLCSYLSEKYPDLHVIDIGANIGDTVAIIREYSQCPILCVEANDDYFALLAANIRRANLQPVEMVRAFVATYTGELKGQLTSSAGTAHFVNSEQSALKTIRLSHLLETYPRFQAPKLIKIDTDGFDCSILRSELEWIGEKRPVLFFEYDPFFFHSKAYDGTQIFEDLSRAGYTFALFYDNVGDYITALDLHRDANIVSDLQHYYIGRRGHQYMDVAAFHREDRDIAEHIRAMEAEWLLRWRGEQTGVTHHH